MTRADFLAALRRVRQERPDWEWSSEDQDVLRADAGPSTEWRLCPITAVYYADFGEVVAPGAWEYAASQLDLHLHDALAIVQAADREAPYSQALREDLLTALYLTENELGVEDADD
jgi:hypothetical protein